MPANEPWTPPRPIAPRGRIAAWTVAGCLAAGGVATIALAWNELTCTAPITRQASREVEASVCEVLTGIGGIAFFLGAAAAAIGIVIAVRVARRILSPTGEDGWRWGLGVIFTVGAIVLVTRFPNLTCPDGVHLSALFALCIDTVSGDRFDATSWVWLKWIAVVVIPVIGFGVVPRRRLTTIAVPLTIVAWTVGIGWLLLDTIGREYL
jgi:hypothetical protein